MKILLEKLVGGGDSVQALLRQKAGWLNIF